MEWVILRRKKVRVFTPGVVSCDIVNTNQDGEPPSQHF